MSVVQRPVESHAERHGHCSCGYPRFYIMVCGAQLAGAQPPTTKWPDPTAWLMWTGQE